MEGDKSIALLLQCPIQREEVIQNATSPWFRGQEAAAHGPAAAGRKPGGLPAHDRLSAGSPADQCGPGGPWLHEPGTDRQAGGILGGEHPAAAAVSGLAGRFRPGRYGHFPALSGPRQSGVGRAAGKLIVADDLRLDHIRHFRTVFRNCGRGQPGKAAG